MKMTKLNRPIASVDIQYLSEQNWRAHFYRRLFSKLLYAKNLLPIILLLNRESIVTTGQRISLIPMNRYIWRGMMSAYVKGTKAHLFNFFKILLLLDTRQHRKLMNLHFILLCLYDELWMLYAPPSKLEESEFQPHSKARLLLKTAPHESRSSGG